MSIARYARKEKMKHGWQHEIAVALDMKDSVVSRVMNDKGADLSPATRRKVQVAIARRLNMSVSECFPPLLAERMSA